MPFIGQEALKKQKEEGAPRRLVGIEMIERGIPRTHYPVYAGEERVGEVTTGTQSPTLKKNVGLALVKRQYSELGTELDVEIRGKRVKAKVVPTPFYKRPKA
jgi:aminomethyltransferase